MYGPPCDNTNSAREPERELLIVMWGSGRIDSVLTHFCSY